jgi:hypothetical protein
MNERDLKQNLQRRHREHPFGELTDREYGQ